MSGFDTCCLSVLKGVIEFAVLDRIIDGASAFSYKIVYSQHIVTGCHLYFHFLVKKAPCAAHRTTSH